jgi:hypothetical protein
LARHHRSTTTSVRYRRAKEPGNDDRIPSKWRTRLFAVLQGKSFLTCQISDVRYESLPFALGLMWSVVVRLLVDS